VAELPTGHHREITGHRRGGKWPPTGIFYWLLSCRTRGHGSGKGSMVVVGLRSGLLGCCAVCATGAWWWDYGVVRLSHAGEPGGSRAGIRLRLIPTSGW
jgi:hypothetical protein